MQALAHIRFAVEEFTTLMKTLLIVYHSQSGSTHRLACAARDGAELEEGVQVRLREALVADSEDLRTADAVLFGTPENFGYMSGGLKNFFDRTFYPLEAQQLNLPYAVFISAGNDGRGAARQIERIVSGYPLRKVADPIITRGEVDEHSLERCRELGQTLAAGLALGVF